MFLLYKKKKVFESPFHHFPLSPETSFLCIMKGMTLKENIIQLAHSIGISKIGFTTADDFAYLEKSLRLACLLYTSDAADDLLCVDLGGRRIIKKKKNNRIRVELAHNI